KRYAEEADLLKQALNLTVRVSGPNHLNESMILNSIGVSYALDRRYGDAEASFRRAILIQGGLGCDARSDLSLTLKNLALACDRRGRYAEALDLASRALTVREADRPNVDSALVEFMLHKAELLRKVHRKKEAAQLEREARQAKAGLKSEDPNQWM